MLGLTKWWHGLNQVVSSISLSPNPLGWDVKAEPVFFADGTPVETEDAQETYDDANGQNMPEKYAHHFWRATDDGLPVGKRSFNPASYADGLNVQSWLDFIQKSIAGIGATPCTIGSVRNRGRLFCTLDVPDSPLKMNNGHEHLTKLTFIRSLDMSCLWHVVACSHDTVCDNTLEMTLAFNSPLKLATKMTTNAPERVENMGKVIDDLMGVSAQFKAAMERFANTPCDATQARNLFAGFEATDFKRNRQGVLVPDSTGKLSTRLYNRVERETELFSRGIGNDGDSLEDWINATTQYYGREASGGENTWKAFESSEHGSARNRKAEAFAMLTGDWQEIANRGEQVLKAFETAKKS